MSNVLSDARKAVQNLSIEDRLLLAHELLEGLEEEPISLEEIDRRLAEMRSGKAETITLEELDNSMDKALDGKNTAHPQIGTA